MAFLKLNTLKYSLKQSVSIKVSAKGTAPCAKPLGFYLKRYEGFSPTKGYRNEPSSASNYKLIIRGRMPAHPSSQSRRIK
jgi:hypothetical protein